MLNVESLEVRYGTAQVIKNVGLAVRPGTIAALLGNNGAGKTTLLRTLSATIAMHGGTATAGTARLDDRNLLKSSPSDIVRSGLVHVPEGRRVFGQLTVEENLLAGALSVRSRRAVQAALDRVMEIFPVLRDRSRQTAGLLSGGEQQMLVIGRGLMSSPKVMLLDEPSLGIAPMVAREIAATIRRISDAGTAVLLVEQNTTLALRVADHVYAMDGGAVVADGPPSEFVGTDLLQQLSLGGHAHGAVGQHV